MTPDARIAQELAGLVADGHAREASERAARARAEEAASQLAKLLADKIGEASGERERRVRAEEELAALRERVVELRAAHRPRRRFTHRIRAGSAD